MTGTEAAVAAALVTGVLSLSAQFFKWWVTRKKTDVDVAVVYSTDQREWLQKLLDVTEAAEASVAKREEIIAQKNVRIAYLEGENERYQLQIAELRQRLTNAESELFEARSLMNHMIKDHENFHDKDE